MEGGEKAAATRACADGANRSDSAWGYPRANVRQHHQQERAFAGISIRRYRTLHN